MKVVAGSLTDEFDISPDLVLAFGTRESLCTSSLSSQLSNKFPNSFIAGCSTAGQFISDELMDEDILLTSVELEHSTIRTASAPVAEPADSLKAGQLLGAELGADDLVAVLVLSDGLSCNGSALAAGLATQLPSTVKIFGGLAADNDQFENTVVLVNGEAQSNVVVAVGFYGDRLEVSTSSDGGWELFGPERKITSSESNVLFELDGEPALELYSKYLGDRAEDLPGSALLFPLAVKGPNQASATMLVRTILGVDADKASMTFAGDIPQGWTAQLMRATSDGLIDGAYRAGTKIQRPDTTTGDGLCLGISCVGRRLVLGQRTDEELDAVDGLLDHSFKFIGFYSYGELAPGSSGRCELHNQTMTLTSLREM